MDQRSGPGRAWVVAQRQLRLGIGHDPSRRGYRRTALTPFGAAGLGTGPAAHRRHRDHAGTDADADPNSSSHTRRRRARRSPHRRRASSVRAVRPGPAAPGPVDLRPSPVQVRLGRCTDVADETDHLALLDHVPGLHVLVGVGLLRPQVVVAAAARRDAGIVAEQDPGLRRRLAGGSRSGARRRRRRGCAPAPARGDILIIPPRDHTSVSGPKQRCADTPSGWGAGVRRRLVAYASNLTTAALPPRHVTVSPVRTQAMT